MNTENSRMNQMECDMTEVKTDIKYIKDNIDEIKEFIKNADNRYASKRIELWIYGLAGIIIVAVFSALLSLVLK